MTFVAAIWLASLVGVVSGALSAPDRTIRGELAKVLLGAWALSGLVLALYWL